MPHSSLLTRSRSFDRFASGIALLAIAASLSCVAGCAPKQTLPATVGEPLFDPSVPPIPELMRIAIETGSAQRLQREGELIFNLPPGVLPVTWKRIGEKLGEHARPMRPGDTEVVSVQEVRLDGGRAHVDVLVPVGFAKDAQAKVPYQLFTIHMTGGVFGPWKVTNVQPWMLRTEAPVCHNPAATVTTPAP